MEDALGMLLSGNILGAVISLIGGFSLLFVFWKIADKLLKKVVIFVFSKEIYIIKAITYLDDNIIDNIKIKTPESGELIEKRLVTLLERLKLIILDQKSNNS